MDFMFNYLCARGNLEDAKNWYAKYPKMNKICIEDAFISACGCGHIDVLKWLLKIHPDIDISAKNEEAFRYACIYGYIDIARWLLKIKPNIIVNSNYEYCFSAICGYGHLNVAKFLEHFNPKYIANIGAKFVRMVGKIIMIRILFDLV